MKNKFYTLGVNILDGWEYMVIAGGVFTRPCNIPGTVMEVIHWFPVEITNTILNTKDQYNYYVERESGDVYRKPIATTTN